MLGTPVVTPLDVFQTYRDQNERVSFKVVAVPSSSFIAKVPEPTDAEVSEFYEKYKDVLPDPDQRTPGFKVPRQIKAESSRSTATRSPSGSRPSSPRTS